MAATLASWLILRPVTGEDGQTRLTVSLDREHLSQLANKLATQVETPPVDAQFRWDYTSGSLGVAVPSVPGRTLDVTSTPPSDPTMPLCTGWNLIGYPSSISRPVEPALAARAFLGMIFDHMHVRLIFQQAEAYPQALDDVADVFTSIFLGGVQQRTDGAPS